MTKPLSFCLVTTFYPPFHFGGDAVFVHRLAKALAERGHRVDVIHSIDAYRLSAREPQSGFDETPGVRRLPLASSHPRLATLAAHQLGAPGPYRARLRELLAPGRYDVIHFHNISLVGGPGVLRCGDAVKLYTTHEYWLVCPTHVLFRYDQRACQEKRCLTCTTLARRPPQWWRSTGLAGRCLAAIDGLLMPSRFALERHRSEGIQAPMHLLPSFVPVPPASAAPSPGGSDFAFVGRLERLKGLQDVIPLFRELPRARLRVAGAGSFEPELRRLAEGIPNVEFLGQLHPSRIADLYRDSLAVVVPSLCFEVFPLAPVEAMAHGVPVIARRIGALTEVVEQSRGGLLFDRPDECLAAMRRLLDTPSLRSELAANGRNTALREWSEAVHVERYLDLVRRRIAVRTRVRAG